MYTGEHAKWEIAHKMGIDTQNGRKLNWIIISKIWNHKYFAYKLNNVNRNMNLIQ